MNKIKIIALIGESGVGKDTLMRTFLTAVPFTLFHEIISCTSRPPREGERNGVNYFFHTIQEIEEKIAKNEMLEYTVFNNWYYGTSYNSINPNRINIGVFNIAGIKSLLARDDIDLKVIYVRASDKQRLIRQLNREENPDVTEIIRRFCADEEDFKDINFEYDTINNENRGDGIRGVLNWLTSNQDWLALQDIKVQLL